MTTGEAGGGTGRAGACGRSAARRGGGEAGFRQAEKKTEQICTRYSQSEAEVSKQVTGDQCRWTTGEWGSR